MYQHNKWKSLSENERWKIYELHMGINSEIDIELVDAYKTGEECPQPIRLVPGHVKSIWRYYATYGFLNTQHDKYLKDMRGTVTYTILFMYRITEICGLTRGCEREYTDPEDGYFTASEYEAFVEWVNGYYCSDYGFPKLNELVLELWAADDLVHILITIDMVLNVWHGSGPLADRFIWGGTETLNKLQFSTVTS